jgi:hypothetical protein
MMKMAGAYMRKGEFLIHSNSRLTSGAWLETEPFFRASRDADPRTLGQLLRSAIAASSEGVPHPDNWNNYPERTLQMANVKSWNAFMKGSRSCSVEQDNEKLRFIPTENRGREGFVQSHDLRFEISAAATDDVLGESLIKAIELSHSGSEVTTNL